MLNGKRMYRYNILEKLFLVIGLRELILICQFHCGQLLYIRIYDVASFALQEIRKMIYFEDRIYAC